MLIGRAGTTWCGRRLQKTRLAWLGRLKPCRLFLTSRQPLRQTLEQTHRATLLMFCM